MSDGGVIAFTDIVGFTEFTASEGDDAALELLVAQRAIIDELLPDGARVVKELGDGLLLWVDDADEALELSRGLQAAFRRTTHDGMPLWVRIGMHWGDPARRGDDLVGHDVNVASRISDQAGPGETLISEAVADRIDESKAVLSPIGPALMKGLPDPVWLYRVET